jgi:hypothetical protein
LALEPGFTIRRFPRWPILQQSRVPCQTQACL